MVDKGFGLDNFWFSGKNRLDARPHGKSVVMISL